MRPLKPVLPKRRSGAAFIEQGFEEAIVPALWAQGTFERKAATAEIANQMWLFPDRAGRAMCLIPEVTALFQEMVQTRELQGERRLFYVARCYRYERPQQGRYREFTQLGVEWLQPRCGTAPALDGVRAVAGRALAALGLREEQLVWDTQATRGLGYYLNGRGFEVRVEALGAQKQVCGGRCVRRRRRFCHRA